MAWQQWEYGTLEWLWDVGSIRVNLPGGRETASKGSYKEIVETLTSLGAEGWDAANCVAASNWLFWTLRRPVG